MELEILDIQGQTTGKTINLPDEIFGIEPNNHTIYLAVKQYLGSKRSGTSKVKTRAEVKGSSRKLHKQKGTGGSRKGNIRNPLYKGGGTVFGPKPRKYDFKLNKKVKDLARVSALSHKANESCVKIIENLNLEIPKTKTFEAFLKATSLIFKKVLLVIDAENVNVQLSTRNIPNMDTIILADINTYEIMNADVIIFSEDAANIINGSIEIDNTELIEQIESNNF